jgi:Brp/Blh family beta-carotene 15,15'-monooxygenase
MKSVINRHIPTLGLFCATLGSLFLMEQHWPLVGIWFLGFVSLTVGMGHGALDALLLMAQFRPRSISMIVGALYLLITIGAGWLLSLSFPIAMISLLLMSVWHFGEIYRSAIVLRVAAGGASVMTPAVLQRDELSMLMQSVTVQETPWLMYVWTGLAWVWLIVVVLLVLSAFGIRRYPMESRPRFKLATWRVMVEIGIVVCLNLVLSPVFQFALYFGLYHCTSHIARVHRAANRHPGFPNREATWAWVISMVIVLILMAALWQWLLKTEFQTVQWSAQTVHWLVVVLGAVTVPHLFLVTYSHRWLSR